MQMAKALHCLKAQFTGVRKSGFRKSSINSKIFSG